MSLLPEIEIDCLEIEAVLAACVMQNITLRHLTDKQKLYWIHVEFQMK